MAALADGGTLRAVLTAVGTRLDGRPGAATVVNQRRRVLYNAAEYAVELGHLSTNPLVGLKWKVPKPSGSVDRRAASNLVLPSGSGWGEIHLEEATPHAGTEWTDDGGQRDRRQLKGRARGERRPVPASPELVELLKQHVREFGLGEDGRLFRGSRSAELAKITYIRAWKAARAIAFVPDVVASPLAATPYSLRHACVSTWLNAGVPPTQVAEWAGHSVEVLLKVYAKCLDGQDEVARQRISDAMGIGPGENPGRT